MKKFCEALQKYEKPDDDVLKKSQILLMTRNPSKIKESYGLVYKNLIKKCGVTLRIDNIPLTAVQKYDGKIVGVKTVHVKETIDEVSKVKNIFLCQGCAFIWLWDPQDAKKVYNIFNGMLLGTTPLKVIIY